MPGWKLAAMAAIPVAAVAYYVYENVVRPGRIPQEEIESLADEMERRHPDDPDDGAFVEEQAAWFRGDIHEQGRWHRVRKALRARWPQRP